MDVHGSKQSPGLEKFFNAFSKNIKWKTPLEENVYKAASVVFGVFTIGIGHGIYHAKKSRKITPESNTTKISASPILQQEAPPMERLKNSFWKGMSDKGFAKHSRNYPNTNEHSITQQILTIFKNVDATPNDDGKKGVDLYYKLKDYIQKEKNKTVEDKHVYYAVISALSLLLKDKQLSKDLNMQEVSAYITELSNSVGQMEIDEEKKIIDGFQSNKEMDKIAHELNKIFQSNSISDTGWKYHKGYFYLTSIIDNSGENGKNPATALKNNFHSDFQTFTTSLPLDKKKVVYQIEAYAARDFIQPPKLTDMEIIQGLKEKIPGYEWQEDGLGFCAKKSVKIAEGDREVFNVHNELENKEFSGLVHVAKTHEFDRGNVMIACSISKAKACAVVQDKIITT